MYKKDIDLLERVQRRATRMVQQAWRTLATKKDELEAME